MRIKLYSNNKILFATILTLSIQLLPAQSVTWFKSGAGDVYELNNGYSDLGYSIATTDNSIFYTGVTTGNSTTFEGEEAISPSNFSFLAKYTRSAGDLEWVRKLPSYGHSDVVVDNSGDIIVVGYSSFDGSMVKYDADGNLIWDKVLLDGAIFPKTRSIAISKDNSILIGGRLTGSGIPETPLIVGDTTINNLTSGSHGFVMKYNAQGNFEWISTSNGGLFCQFDEISIDSDDNVVAIGEYRTFHDDILTYREEVVLGDFSLISTTDSTRAFPVTSPDIILAKFGADGKVLWVKSIGGQGNELGTDVTINSADEILITGSFTDSLIFEDEKIVSNGLMDILTMKLGSDGSLRWLQTAGSSSGFSNSPETGRGITLDNQGSVLVSGTIRGIADFGEEENQISSSAGSTKGIGFLAKYLSSGEIQWVLNFSSGPSRIQAIDAYDEKIYMTGNYFPPTKFQDHQVTTIHDETPNFFIAEIENTILNAEVIEGNLVIYPNPTSDFFMVKYANIETKFDITVFSESGKIILRKPNSSSSYRIPVTHLGSGIYFVQIKNEDMAFTKRIVIKE